jgi:hypothetical protein
LAPIIRVFISRTGIRWALRWLGLLNFGVTFPLSFIVKSHGGKAGSTQLVNLRVARRKVFVFEVWVQCPRESVLMLEEFGCVFAGGGQPCPPVLYLSIRGIVVVF